MGVRLVGKYGVIVLVGQNFAVAKPTAAPTAEKVGEFAGVSFLVKALNCGTSAQKRCDRLTWGVVQSSENSDRILNSSKEFDPHPELEELSDSC